jgi:hypothetical protein
MRKKLINQKKKIINMRKGIAVNTILMMLVGIVVVGVIIYLVYKSLTNPSLSDEQCRSRLISQCMICRNMNWVSDVLVPSELLNDCAKGIFVYWKLNANCQADFMVSDCKALGIE